uniref:Glycoside hydrolase putative n=1 Tax=Albugo laibachii Nc14 TaxID=890382 RepID=F0W755_9STRA|nr:glycoside hydrolase putative [Albugo laibachii Nc14]|eukprot:CCA16954.1 glycoside hydrolase putative [Albugo laibachii Nc14]
MLRNTVLILLCGCICHARKPEKLCALVPESYENAKRMYPEAKFALETMEAQTIATWYTDRDPNSAFVVEKLLKKCPPTSRIVLVVYGMPQKDCEAQYSSGSSSVKDSESYRTWLQQLASSLGNRTVLYIVEPDAISLSMDNKCGVEKHYASHLEMAIEVLSVNKNADLYLDVGYWSVSTKDGAKKVADFIKRVCGPRNVAGIVLNTSNYRTIPELEEDCTNFQDAIHSKQYRCVVDTSRDMKGASRTSEWCNYKDAGIGPPPTEIVPDSSLSYLAYLKVPGESDGFCNDPTRTSDAAHGPAAGEFSMDLFTNLWNNGYYVLKRKSIRITDGNQSPAKVHGVRNSTFC